MSPKLNGWGLAALLLALVVAIGCSDSAQEDAAAATAADDAAWAELEEQKQQLEAAREELAEAREVADAEDGEAGGEDAGEAADDAAEGDAEAADPAAEVARLENQVNEQAADFYQAIVDYINNSGMVEGEEPTERQSQALRMKSAEDMILAKEYIDKGGNYPKAISIYEDSLRLDPDNEELQAALANAQEMRYMSEERFAQAEEGMTQDEIRETLGQPNLSNIRKFPEDNVEAWFYAVDANGSAAAVWFRERGDEMTAYKVNFEEVVRDGPTEVGAEDEA